MIKMLGDNVLVENVREMEIKAGAIFLPDAGMQYGYDETASQRRYDCNMGEIVDFGEKALNLKRGQTCYLLPLKGKEFTQDGKEYRIYKYVEVIGVVEDAT